MTKLSFSSIFEAVTNNPDEAADLQFRSDLMIVLTQIIKDRGLKQAQVAEILSVPQPRVSELMTGKINQISSDKLIGYLAKMQFRMRPSYVNEKLSIEVIEAA